MLTGQPATFQRFTAPRLAGSPFQALIPSDLDGSTPPPAAPPTILCATATTKSMVRPAVPLSMAAAPGGRISVDISAALGSSNVVLRFAFDTGDATGNAFEGFHVDDVVVTIDGTAVFTDDFESGAAGWTGTGLWHLTTACSAPLSLDIRRRRPSTMARRRPVISTREARTPGHWTLQCSIWAALAHKQRSASTIFSTPNRRALLDDVRVQISTDGGATFTDVIGNCFALPGDPTADFLEIWEFRVDFADPANSTLTGPISIPTAEFDSDLCGADASAA